MSDVFIGGGTPSLFSPEAIDRLLAGVRARLPLAPDAEVTMEANPGTVRARRFAGYARRRRHRLSIGVQSFDAALLARPSAACTTRAQARAAAETRRALRQLQPRPDVRAARPDARTRCAPTSSRRSRSRRRTCRATT
jgi:coproporphyrinogen III oxidase-like Fe-S oxidoreductase